MNDIDKATPSTRPSQTEDRSSVYIAVLQDRCLLWLTIHGSVLWWGGMGNTHGDEIPIGLYKHRPRPKSARVWKTIKIKLLFSAWDGGGWRRGRQPYLRQNYFVICEHCCNMIYIHSAPAIARNNLKPRERVRVWIHLTYTCAGGVFVRRVYVRARACVCEGDIIFERVYVCTGWSLSLYVRYLNVRSHLNSVNTFRVAFVLKMCVFAFGMVCIVFLQIFFIWNN